MTTFHALQRTQERAGLNLKQSSRFISNAIKRGLKADEFESAERDYLKSYEYSYGCYAIVYNSFCFIVSDGGICITMFTLPKWFGKKRLFYGKERVRDTKKFFLSYMNFDLEEDRLDIMFA